MKHIPKPPLNVLSPQLKPKHKPYKRLRRTSDDIDSEHSYSFQKNLLKTTV